MKRFRSLSNLPGFLVVSALLVLLSSVAAVYSIVINGLGADAAAWVQAAGSIAAIAGAVWLADRQDRLQRRTRRAEREETAWGVRFAVVQAMNEAREIAAEVVSEAVLEDPRQRLHWMLRTQNSKNILSNFMARTDHVHPSAIQVTSNALLLVTQMEMDLGKVLTFIEAGQRPPIEVAAQIAWYEGYFDGLIQAYDASMRGVQQALDEGGDVLPIRNYAAWHVLKANSLNE